MARPRLYLAFALVLAGALAGATPPPAARPLPPRRPPPPARGPLRILALPLVAGRSHTFMMAALAGELAGRGHDVQVGRGGRFLRASGAPARGARGQPLSPPPQMLLPAPEAPSVPPPLPGGAPFGLIQYDPPAAAGFEAARGEYAGAGAAAARPLARAGALPAAFAAASLALLNDTVLMHRLKLWAPHAVVADTCFAAGGALAARLGAPLATLNNGPPNDPLHSDAFGFPNDAGALPQFGTGLGAPLVGRGGGGGCFLGGARAHVHRRRLPPAPPDLPATPLQPAAQARRPRPHPARVRGALEAGRRFRRRAARRLARVRAARAGAHVQCRLGARVVRVWGGGAVGGALSRFRADRRPPPSSHPAGRARCPPTCTWWAPC